MNEKLRLLVTADCPNNCPMCCNNQFSLSKLPLVDRINYKEIMITGGEPLYHLRSDRYRFHSHNKVFEIANAIKSIWEMSGWEGKIYIYTATKDLSAIIAVVNLGGFDGIVYTPHDHQDVSNLFALTLILPYHLERRLKRTDIKNHDFSLRLNLFPEIITIMENNFSKEEINNVYDVWNVKNIEWVDNCPIPEGEDFRRIHKLIRYK